MFEKIFNKNSKELPKDVREVLEKFGKLEERFEKLSSDLSKLREEDKLSVQRVGIVRFNPFSESGGDQSFSIALLNGKNDGVVITSLYTRGENRVYGKPIKDGKSEYQLSEEEKTAMAKAEENK